MNSVYLNSTIFSNEKSPQLTIISSGKINKEGWEDLEYSSEAIRNFNLYVLNSEFESCIVKTRGGENYPTFNLTQCHISKSIIICYEELWGNIPMAVEEARPKENVLNNDTTWNIFLMSDERNARIIRICFRL